MARAKGPGRPPLGPQTVRINIKVDAADRERWHRAAARDGMQLSEWLRALAEKAAR